MKRLIVLLLSVIVLFSSCNDTQTSQKAQNEITKVGNDTLQLDPPINLKQAIRLTPQAQEGVKNWSFYRNLSTAIDSVQALSIGKLKVNLKRFDALYLAEEEGEEAEIELTPDIFKKNAIQARLIVIETKTKVLNNDVYLNTPDANHISHQVGEVYNAYQDLNLQLNELFDVSFKDLLEEIKQENEKAAASGLEK